MIAIAAILNSQILIFIYWKDAKFGTVANVIVLLAVILSYGAWSFDKMVSDELNSFLPEKMEKRVITEEMIIFHKLHRDGLSVTNIIGKEEIHTVHLRQKGEMRIREQLDES